MLAGVRLDLQLKGHRRGVFGIEAVDELDAAFALLTFRLPKPWIEHAAHRVHHRSRGLRLRLDEIDVLRVPRGRTQMQLVKRRAAAERQRVMQHRMREDLDQRAANDEILFHLEVLNPRRPRAPLSDVVARDHRLDSTATLMYSFQSSLRAGFCARAPPGFGALGRSGADSCARARTYAFIGPSFSPPPTCSSS